MKQDYTPPPHFVRNVMHEIYGYEKEKKQKKSGFLWCMLGEWFFPSGVALIGLWHVIGLVQPFLLPVVCK